MVKLNGEARANADGATRDKLTTMFPPDVATFVDAVAPGTAGSKQVRQTVKKMGDARRIYEVNKQTVTARQNPADNNVTRVLASRMSRLAGVGGGTMFRLSPQTKLTRLTSPGWLLGMSMLIGNGMPAADATEGALCNCRGSTGQQVQAVDRDHAHTCNINGSKSTHDAVVRVVEKLMIKQGGTRVRHNKTEPRREDFFGASSSHRGPDIKATINGTVNIYDVTGIAQDAKSAASAFLRTGTMETMPRNYRRATAPPPKTSKMLTPMEVREKEKDNSFDAKWTKKHGAQYQQIQWCT